MRLAGIAACAVAVAACEAPAELAECPTMPVKGWGTLPHIPAFAALSHRRDQPYNAISETSYVLWSDSNFSYERLLTFDMAHPRFAAGAVNERCIRNVSFMAATPVQGTRAESLGAFVEFLGSHGAAASLVKAIETARANNAAFASVGAISEAPVSAGVIAQGARGTFFRVEIGAAK